MVYDVTMLIRAQLMLPKEVYDSLRLEAAIKSTSMSKLATLAIISKIKKKVYGVDFLNYLAKNAYKGKNVPRDLSTNDEYLYGVNIK